MKYRLTPHALFLAALLAGSTLFGGEPDKKVVTPTELEPDHWKFMLSMPGWIPWLDGTMGLNGVTAPVHLTPQTIIPHIDMIADVRAEATKGRFSVMGEFLYMSLSDGIGTKTIVKKLDVRLDETMGDLGFGWRLIDSPKGYLDVTAGVRYWSMYERVIIQPDRGQINEKSTQFVDSVADQIAKALNAKLSSALANEVLRGLISQKIDPQLGALKGNRPTVPIAPIGDGQDGIITTRIQGIVDAQKADLAAAVQAQLDAKTAALKAAAQAKVDKIKSDLSYKIAKALSTGLNTRVSRTDYWLDPYVGLRGRYNLNDKFYLTAKGDVGGFSVGSKFAWSAEAALGWQMMRNISTEIGYRAVGLDYDNELLVKTITHGPQITLGITF
jgi:hypothetical protein